MALCFCMRDPGKPASYCHRGGREVVLLAGGFVSGSRDCANVHRRYLQKQNKSTVVVRPVLVESVLCFTSCPYCGTLLVLHISQSGAGLSDHCPTETEVHGVVDGGR